jgi:hypothetical protein
MNNSLNLTNVRKWSNLVISILWILISAVMLTCLISSVVAGNPLLICVALFTFSIDGINAYMYFRTYLTYHKLIQELKDAERKVE